MRAVVLFFISAATMASASNIPTLDPTFADQGVSTVGFDFGHGGNNGDSLRTFVPSTNGRILLGGTYATGPAFLIGSYNYLPTDLGIVRLPNSTRITARAGAWNFPP